MQPHSLVAIVTLTALLVYLWMGLRVAGARKITGIAAPAMTGDPRLERQVRVQANTLEWLPLFLVSLWLFAIYWNDRIAALLGVVWIIGRILYAFAYAADPGKRAAGFLIQALATGVLRSARWAGRSTSWPPSAPEGRPLAPPVDPARYAAFWGVMTVMALTPGPANLFAIATGARRGKAAALAGVAGMNSATLVWFLGAALGLSALIVAFPAVFRLLAWAGAAYVAWLGLQALLAARRPPQDSHAPARSGASAYLDGFTVQIANPKVLLFFTAVLPPFVDIRRPLGLQLAAFAGATLIMDGLAMSAYGLGGAAIARRMSEPRFRRGFQVFQGLLLLAAATLIAIREI